MAVRIHNKDGSITEVTVGRRVTAGAWKSTDTAKADGGASAKRLKDALDRVERTLKGTRPKNRSF